MLLPFFRGISVSEIRFFLYIYLDRLLFANYTKHCPYCVVAAVGGAVLSHPPWLAPYSIVGGFEHAPIDTLRQVGHPARLGILARPREYLT